MKQFFTLLFLILPIPALAQNCSHLKNGAYQIVYDSKYADYPKRIYEIINDTCYVIENGEREKYELHKTYACRFWLTNNKVVDTTHLTKLQKALLKERPFFDIYKVVGNSYYFILRINLHVQSYSGKFVKISN